MVNFCLKWRLKIKFLINLGRKIKNQRHIFVVGDRGIHACFDHHIHTVSLALLFPLKPEVVGQSFLLLAEDLLQLIQSDEPYKKQCVGL